MQGGLKRLHGRPGALRTEGRVAAGHDAFAGIEHIVAQDDVLAGYVLLILAVAVIETDHAAVGCGSLRPVDPPVVESELLGRMVPGRQIGDERGYRAVLGVDGHDPGAVVLPGRMGRLIRVGREQPPTLQPSSNAMSTAGPSGCKPPALVGFASIRSNVPS